MDAKQFFKKFPKGQQDIEYVSKKLDPKNSKEQIKNVLANFNSNLESLSKKYKKQHFLKNFYQILQLKFNELFKPKIIKIDQYIIPAALSGWRNTSTNSLSEYIKYVYIPEKYNKQYVYMIATDNINIEDILNRYYNQSKIKNNVYYNVYSARDKTKNTNWGLVDKIVIQFKNENDFKKFNKVWKERA